MKKNVMMLLSLILSLGLAGCGNNTEKKTDAPTEKPTVNETTKPTEAPATEVVKTPLASISNFKVIRNEEGKWVVQFDAVEHATTYLLNVKVGESSFIDAEIENDHIINPGADAGTYTFSLVASDSTKTYLDSEAATFEIVVELYNGTDIEGIKYTGRKENNIPIGNYHIVYADGSTFDGTLTDEFKRANGKHQYPNKMYYEGEFVNDQFEGEGMFTWSITGNWKDGNTYKGKFVAGNYNEQVGTYYTAANWTRPIDYNGILNFTGTMGPSFGAPGKAGTTGKGEFSFANNSIYSGDLLKGAGEWDFMRSGWGKNTWTVTEPAGWITGGDASYTIDNFEGQFDQPAHAWIYGDGVWYFKKDGKPFGYVKGNWDGGSRLGNNTMELTIQEEYKDARDLTPAI